VVKVNSEAEATTFVDLAREMDDGEALTCALAVHRQCDVATDERKARRILSTRAPQVLVTSTLALVKQWAELAGIAKAELRAVLLNIRSGANYFPGERDPLYPWWIDIVS
jgi:predicted nucleic acid-binding protein